MTLRLVHSAEADLRRAVAHYEEQRPGLGHEFGIEINHAFDQIEEFPEGWQKLELDVRRYRLRRFPYGVVYLMERGQIVVLAVMHLHRAPNSWRKRIKEI